MSVLWDKICKTLTPAILFILPQLSYCQAPVFNAAYGAGSVSFDEALSSFADADGNIYTAGYFSGTVDFDPSAAEYNLTASGPTDIFIQKINAGGSLIWAYRFGGELADRCLSMSPDNSGNIYMTGFFSSTATFTTTGAATILTSKGAEDIFLLKLDNNSNILWAKKAGSFGSDAANTVTTDASGNVIIAGSFSGSVTFGSSGGPVILTSNGYNDIFISKYNAAGNFMWARGEGGTHNDAVNAVCTSPSGKIYLTGYFSDTVDFNTGTGIQNEMTRGGIDFFVQKLDANGDFIWAKSAGGTGADEGKAITADHKENVYITGRFNGTVDFDPDINNTLDISSNGKSDAFIIKITPAGNMVFAKTVGGSSSDAATGIVISNRRDLFVTGYFSGTADFDPGGGTYILTSTGQKDAFTGKLDVDGNFIWAANSGGAGNDVAQSVTVNINSKIILSGYFNNDADFDYTTNTLSLTSAGSSDFFTALMDNCSSSSSIPSAEASLITICSLDTTLLYISSGDLNSSVRWVWYADGCGQTLAGYGDSIRVSPDINTTYYVRGEGGCVPASLCGTIAIQVNPAQVSYKDEDGDGFFGDSSIACNMPLGNGWAAARSANGGNDCNDLDNTINPATVWYKDNDNDLYYSATAVQCTKPGGNGWSLSPGNGGGDCADFNAARNPGVTEICGNQIDDNCNGVTDEDCLQVDLSGTTINCSGGSSTLTAVASNGTPPYKYSFDGGPFKGLNTTTVTPGTHTVIAVDALSNGASDTVIITAPSAITVNYSKADVSCYGGSDGAITIHAAGGTPPYQYSFDDGVTYQQDSVKGNLPAGGSFILRVKDANNCTMRRQGPITIVQPSKLKITGTCYSPSNKVLGVQATGGTPPYTFSLNGSSYSAGNQLNGSAKTWPAIQAGVYTFFILDAKNCLLTKAVKTDTLPACPSSAPLSSGTPVSEKSVTGSDELKVLVYPNPSSDYFTLVVNSNDKNKILLNVTDASGRIIYTASAVAGQRAHFGDKFLPGVYIAEVISGDKKLHIKIIKQ